MNAISDIKCAEVMAGVGYLGPATVLEVNEGDGLLLVEWLKGEERCRSWARPALTGLTKLAPGDVALVISQNLRDFYAIGLLTTNTIEDEDENKDEKNCREFSLERHSGTEKTRVVIEKGDLEFVTKEGSISFESAREIRFGAPTLRLTARRMEAVIETMVSKARNVFQRVEELTQVQTGRLRTLVKGAFLVKARNASMKAEKDFKVDGQKIHLG